MKGRRGQNANRAPSVAHRARGRRRAASRTNPWIVGSVVAIVAVPYLAWRFVETRFL